MRILSRKNHARRNSVSEEEQAGHDDVDFGTGPVAAPPVAAPPGASVVDTPEKAEPAPPVEDELARVEEEAAAEESEIRMKAADLLAPTKRDLESHINPIPP